MSRNEETFWRMIRDFWDKCPYCNNKTLSQYVMTPPEESLLCNKPGNNTGIECNTCHKKMTHLEWRGYGVDWMKRTKSNFPKSDFGISKYDNDRHAPWKETKKPLWAIGE